MAKIVLGTLGPQPGSRTWLGADTKLGRDLVGQELSPRYVPGAEVHHHIDAERMTWEYVIERSVTYGRSLQRIETGTIFGSSRAWSAAEALRRLSRALILTARFNRWRGQVERAKALGLAKEVLAR